MFRAIIYLIICFQGGLVVADTYDEAMKAFSNQDYEKSYALLLSLSRSNHAGAQYLLAKHYYIGEGVSTDLQEGLRLHELAAKNGDTGAQFNLGVLYDPGVDLGASIVKTRNFETAMYWYEESAKNGHAEGQFNYGVTFLSSEGKYIQDYSKAAFWIHKSAEQGLIAAQVKYGLMYIHGAGVPKDVSKAIYWYEIAGNAGDAEAQYGLGVIYDQGDGIPKDEKMAIYWFDKAAKQGHPGAEHNLNILQRESNN